MDTTYIITFKVKEAYLTEFSELMNNIKSSLPTVDGCNAVDIFHDKKAHSYTLVETWKTEQHHEKHIQNLIQDGTWSKVSTLLTEDPSGYYCQKM